MGKNQIRLNEGQMEKYVNTAVRKILKEHINSDDFFGDLNNMTDNFFNQKENEDDQRELDMCCKDLSVYLEKIRDSYDPDTIRKALELELEKYNEY